MFNNVTFEIDNFHGSVNEKKTKYSDHKSAPVSGETYTRNDEHSKCTEKLIQFRKKG